MARFSRSSLIAGLLVLLLLFTAAFMLLPRTSRDQALASRRPKHPTTSAIALPAPALVRAPAPTSTPAATIAPRPTSTPMPTAIPTDAPPTGDLGAALDRYMNNLVDAKLFHGTVLVARAGTIILSKGYGPADSDHGIANSANTRLRIASVTKQFTAAAVMQLVAQGKLHVEDPICMHIDNCPERWHQITIQHLLTHTHGLPNFTDFPSYEQTQMNPITVSELLDKLRLQWPVWRPGAEYHYGNTGYVLLGAIIERVSGQQYGDYLHDHVFAPLGMDNTGVTYAPAAGENWALPYQSFSRLAPPLDTSTLFAAGAVYSTVEDMYRWDQALYSDQIVPQAQRDAMFTPFLNKYGYGWKIIDFKGHLCYRHPGEMDGARTMFQRYPNDRVTVIVLANMHDANTDAIANYLAQVVFDS